MGYQKNEKSWQAPPFTETGQKRMGWLEEGCIQEGENWLRGQAAYNDVPKGLDIIAGKLDSKANQQRSNLNINHAKYLVRKIISILADVKAGGIYTSDAKFFAPRVQFMNKTVNAICLEANFPRSLRQSLQYMSIGGRSYLWPRVTRANAGYGELKFEFVPLGLLDVLPVQLPANNSLQGAYSVTIIEYMPVWMAHGKYREFQDRLLPVARRRYTSTVAARRMDLAERFKYGEPSGTWDELYCEIRHTLIRDLSVNYTDRDIPMGEWKNDEPQTSWSYKVPYVGKLIPKPGGGERKATPEDCLIYPQLRLMRTSKGMRTPIYDGPAPDWGGNIPLASYCADDWPWEACGYSTIHDIFSIERSRQTIERLFDQIAKARLDPTIAFDRTMGLNDATGQTIDPFATAKRLGVDGDPTKVFSTVLGEEILSVPGWAESFVKYLNDMEDKQLGLNEFSALAEFKASLQSDDSVDKVLNLVGPLVKDISSGMEASTVDIWNCLRYMVPQYLTTSRAMQLVGPDNIPQDTFDFDPEKLIPSHGPDEVMGLAPGVVIPNDSKYTLSQRSKMFAENMRLLAMKHRLHEITEMQEQLKYLQLFRGGFPIAPHDVAKKLNIENFGDIDGATMFDRWVNWEKLKLELAAKAQQLASSLMPQGAAAPGGNQPAPGGRPPSGKKPPKIQQKGGASGPRTTVTES